MLNYEERRKYRQGGFEYLLDDVEKTAWINKGRIPRVRRYRLPDHVIIDGQCYTIESVELGAFLCPNYLHHLVIPDSYTYIADGAFFFRSKRLRSVYIGKGLEYIDNFSKLLKTPCFVIDKENPHLKLVDGMILSKDGKAVWASKKRKRRHVVLPEGVEEVNQIAFSSFEEMETLTMPNTLKKTTDNSFSSCPRLRSVVLPEGFTDCGIQCFMEDVGLTFVDLPSTLTNLGCETFYGCKSLRTVILRSKQIPKHSDAFCEVPTDELRLYVPAQLVEHYRRLPNWNYIKNILPIEEHQTEIDNAKR